MSETSASTRAKKTGAQHGDNQFRLLRERRFAPFFWTQFLGALNDNVFKVGFTSLVTFSGRALFRCRSENGHFPDLCHLHHPLCAFFRDIRPGRR